eukprot:XP_016873134.1 anoctamin-9 isoform X2 [Homo sapiens]
MQGEESLRILVEPEGDSFPLMEISTCETEASEQWDYVLVAQRHTQRDPRQARQQQFLEELRRKGFHIKVIRDQKQVFFGIRADNSVFGLYRTLLLEPEGPAPHAELAAPTTIPVTTSLRIRIVNFVVMNNKTSAGETFEDLMKDGVFEARFPLHKGEGRLKKTWARWRHMFREQPVDEIRNYFGEKVALYFVWLGWYTYMLVPAALTGLLVFLSGFSLFEASQISKEICEAHDILMCPLGDHSRRYQRLSETCTFAKLTHLFDNDGTVVFAIFMALWATVFLEIWKRQRARVVLHWDLYVWDEEQEEMALQLINCPDYKLRPYQHSYLRSTVILVLTLLMICLMIGMAHVLVVYRVLASALFSSSAVPFLEEQVTTAVVVTGALVHYVTIIIMTKINRDAQDLLGAREQVHHPLLHTAVLHPFLVSHLHRLHPGQLCRTRKSQFCWMLVLYPLEHSIDLSTQAFSCFILIFQDQRPPREVHAPGGLVEAGRVPRQRLHDGPLRADGHHHGPEADAQQLRRVPGPVGDPQVPLSAGLRVRAPAPGPRAQGLAAQLPSEPGQHLQPVRRVHGDDDPVRLHHHLRGRLPAGAAARALQQPRGDPPGRHQDGLVAAAPGAAQGQGHRSDRAGAGWAGTGRPQACGLPAGQAGSPGKNNLSDLRPQTAPSPSPTASDAG